MWEALFINDPQPPDQHTLHEMRKKLDLERFQIEVKYFLMTYYYIRSFNKSVG